MYVPKLGEPGYWADKLRDAKTEVEFAEAYLEHKKELEKLPGGTLRPYNVLCARIIGRVGQYGMGESKDDARREDVLFVLREIQRYLVLTGGGSSGLNASSAVRRRTLAELEADVACAVSSVMGFERSQAVIDNAFPAESASPTSRMYATVIDLECDHGSAPCAKCERVRERIGKAVDVVMTERDQLESQSRNAGVVFAFGSDMSKEDLEKTAKDGLRRGAKSELELRKRKEERNAARGKGKA